MTTSLCVSDSSVVAALAVGLAAIVLAVVTLVLIACIKCRKKSPRRLNLRSSKRSRGSLGKYRYKLSPRPLPVKPGPWYNLLPMTSKSKINCFAAQPLTRNRMFLELSPTLGISTPDFVYLISSSFAFCCRIVKAFYYESSQLIPIYFTVS